MQKLDIARADCLEVAAATPAFCGGGGDSGGCLASLWQVIDEARSAVAERQGPDGPLAC
ncbi:MAG TPA: hypothetical protein VF872_00095 [Gaiellaceae bacterium]